MFYILHFSSHPLWKIAYYTYMHSDDAIEVTRVGKILHGDGSLLIYLLTYLLITYLLILLLACLLTYLPVCLII